LKTSALPYELEKHTRLLLQIHRMKLSLSIACRLAVTALLIFAIIALPGCNRQKSRVKASLDQYLKPYKLHDIQYQTYATDPAYPDRAYFSAIITWNHADRRGNLEKEYMGYLLDRDGNDWKVEKTMPYTQDQSEAVKYLSGRAK
jgi:hypothetical protein